MKKLPKPKPRATPLRIHKHKSPLWSKTNPKLSGSLNLPKKAVSFLPKVMSFILGLIFNILKDILKSLLALVVLVPFGVGLLVLTIYDLITESRGRPRIQPLPKFYFQKIKKFLFRLVPRPTRSKIILVALAALFLFYSISLVKVGSSLPSPSQLYVSQRPLTTQIYDRQGKLLYQFYEGYNRKLVQLDELPKELVQATISIEDKNFYSHPGVDISGILRALKVQFSEGVTQGGSTISQQLIKNTLLTSDRTITRKVKEVVLAIWLEKIYTKDEILQMYFNEVAYGGPAWGIEAASQMYFGKSASNLNLSESAYLAGLPASPTEFSPYGTHPEKGKDRQHEVLRRMVEDGFISNDEASNAQESELAIHPPRSDIHAPHFVMLVKDLLATKYGNRTVSQGGLKVVTTLDLGLQESVESIVSTEVSKLANLRVSNGAAMVVDSQNGQILAMVGSKEYFGSKDGNFNVTLALRQPGSSIKPITYLTAFKKGFSPGSILLDTQTTFTNPWGAGYTPVNYDGKFHGPVTIRQSLGSSYNVPAVKLLSIIGISDMLQTAREMGITTLNNPEDYGLSLTLGGGAVRMIEMMSVYQTLAHGGVNFTPLAILTVTDSNGNIIEDNRTREGKRVVPEELSYLVTDILADNKARTPAFGENSLLKIPKYTAAVKTGTSDEKRDNWAFGYTPEFVVGAWVGNNDNSPMDPQLASGVTGATPIWHNIMVTLLTDRPNLAFKKPAGIVELNVDGRKDLGIAGQIPKTVVSYKKIKKPAEDGKGEKEVISYTDPFNTLTLDSSKVTQ